MADTPAPRMNVGPSGSLAGGVGIASVIAFFWNLVRRAEMGRSEDGA